MMLTSLLDTEWTAAEVRKWSRRVQPRSDEPELVCAADH